MVHSSIQAVMGLSNSKDTDTSVGRNPDFRNTRVISRPTALLAADCVSFATTLLIALLSAMLVRFYFFDVFHPPKAQDISRIWIVFGSAFVILLFRSWTLGHYSRFRPFWHELQELIKTVFLIAAFDVFILFAIGVQFSRLWFVFFLLYLCFIVAYGREKTKALMIKRDLWFQPTYIVGVGDNAMRTAVALSSDSSLGHKIEGFVDLNESSSIQNMLGYPVYKNLEQAVDLSGPDTKLVFAFDKSEEMEEKKELINRSIATSVQVILVPPSMEIPLYSASVVGIFKYDTVLLKIQNKLADPNAQLQKRLIDIILGTLFLIVLSPIFIILSVVIRRDGGPIFYSHERVGKNGRSFSCLKFRSMVVDSAAKLKSHLESDPEAIIEWESSQKLKNDPRVTPVGHYLRTSSLDELPQLLNVIKGEMSLVGPRPIVEDEVKHYGASSSYYLTMKPGMTGLWQVSGRTDTSYQERVRLDVWYSRNWNLWNDMVILIKTCKTLINRHGAY